MNEAVLRPVVADGSELAPLAYLNGAAPPAPQWFTDAIDAPHERGRLMVDGAWIEWLGWGERDRPGLLLLHGNGAHAEWWRFIAPLLADRYRVVAFSWSGMGNSDHREDYSIDLFVAEILAVAESSGLLDAGPFVAMGHSFGGFPLMTLANRAGAPLSRAIILDTPFDGNSVGRSERGATARPNRVYATLPEALARFRWEPQQPTRNMFICDFVARKALKQVEGGFTWKFDSAMWRDFYVERTFDLLANPICPLAMLWGEKSALLTPEIVAGMAKHVPAGTPMIAIPEAHHHVMMDQPLALVSALRALLA